ncbi:PLxRFG domain-containing protein [Ottowia testudinis]|uniref:PLxRFG domain-containing protein n=1 Tax=Ottowia testudinis TaxID=2816950 RepID=A0A975H2T8_9BURK|nr:PLxRFG domain-containing protein [Ottowia testudinis]QTD44551.1 PLxRFG domain-containing protein [Ottowia testudinis]
MSEVNWSDYTPVNPSPDAVDWSQYEVVKPAGMVRKLADIGTAFTGGAVGATKAIADAGGAGNAVSSRLSVAQDSVQGWLSPQRQAEKAARAQIIQDAEKSGSGWQEAMAHLGGIAEAPVSTLAEAAGSVVPVVGSMLTPVGRRAGARTLMGIGLGTAQGAGSVKGSIYDAVQKQNLEQGATPEAARQAAEAAQAYTGPNADNIALGAGIGAVTGTTGVEHLVSRAMAGKAAAGGLLRRAASGAAAEGVPEAIQGGQERYSSNVAQQRAGFDVPTWEGVAGQAVAEGVAGGMLGGVTGASMRQRPRQRQTDSTPVPESIAQQAPMMNEAGPAAVPEINPADGPISKASAMAGDLELAPAPPPAAPAAPDARTGLEAVADRLSPEQQRAARMVMADLDQADLPPVMRAMREFEARELAAAAPVPEPGVDDMPAGVVVRSFDPRAGVPPPARVDPSADVGAVTQDGLDFTAKPDAPDTIGQRITQLAMDADLTPGVPLRLNEVHMLRTRAADSGIALSVVPHPSGRGYDVQPTARLAPGQQSAMPQTQANATLGYDTAPTGLMVAGQDGVRVQTQADRINEAQRAAEQATQATEQNQPTAPTSQAVSAIESVANDRGAEPEAHRPGLVLQNRDRSTAASISQMNAIAAKPDYLRTGPSRTMDSGAPVAFGDVPASAMLGRTETVADGRGDRVQTQYAVVEAADVLTSNHADGTPVREYAAGQQGKLRAVAGNGRAAGIAEAYRRGTATDYRTELAVDAQVLGIDPQALANMREPVLVRVMAEQDVKPDIGDRSNTSGTARLSPVEEAANDAQRVDLAALQFDDAGVPTASSVRGFVTAMPEAERGNMLNPDGTPTRQAVDRLMAATFKQAYGSDDLVRLHAQATDPEARAVMAALADAAGPMAQLVGAGEFDIRRAVADAAGMAVNATRRGLRLSEVMQNANLDMHPEAFVVARFMAENIRSSKRMAEGLRDWAQLALEQMQIARDNRQQAGMFGQTPTLSRQQLFEGLGREQQSQTRNDTAQPGGPEPAGEGVARREAERRRNGSGAADGAVGRGTAGQRAAAQGLAQPERPAKWRSNFLQTAKVASDLGIDHRQHQGLAELVAAIDAHDAQLAGAFDLTAPTKQQAVNQQAAKDKDARERAAEPARARAEAAKALNEKEVAARQQASTENFQLGQNGDDALSGQGLMFSRGKPTGSTTDIAAAAGQEVERWQERLRSAAANAQAKDPSMATPAVMRAMGAKSHSLVLPRTYLRAIRDKHADVPAEVFQNLPALLADPLFIIPHRDGGLRVFVESQTARGEPIAVGVSVGQDGRIHTVTPLHDHPDMTGQQRMARDVLNAKGRIYARNKEALVKTRASAAAAPATIALHRDSISSASVLTREQVVKRIESASGPNAPRYSFAGPQAATADQHALTTAQERITAGEDAEAVRQDTGWHTGADGRWRFEISDHDASLKLTPEEFRTFARGDQAVSLGDLLDHPALFAAYPSLAEMPVGMKVGRGASFNPRTGRILMGGAVSPAQFQSILLHEVQHGIQTVEGFASGGAVSQFQGDLTAQRDQYRRQAGEVEARNTQAREKLTDEQRRAFTPESTQDVASDDVIVSFNGKDVASAPPPANATPDHDDRTTLSDAARAQAVSVVQGTVDAVRNAWANGPEVIVAFDMNDPVIPVSARRADLKQRSGGARGAPEGFYHQGKVYLMASKLRTPNDAARVLFHEALGHHGLRGLFGKELTPILNQIATMRRAEVDAKIKEYGLRGVNKLDRRAAAEEVLAEMAQRTPHIGFVRRAIAVIRSWLRQHVPGFSSLRLTDDELIRNFILPARAWVERGAVPGTASTAADAANTDTMFSRAPQDEPRQAQRMGDVLSSVTVTDVKRMARHKATDLRPLGLQFLGRRQLVDVYSDMLPELKAYNDLMARMDADKNDVGAGADQLAQEWAKLKDERALADLMHDATLAQMDPAKDFVEGDNRVQYGALRRRYEALTPEAREVYANARDTYSRHMQDVRSAITERIQRSELSNERKAEMLKRMDNEFFGRIKGVYFPLARFGQYVVVVTGSDGKVANVSRAETMSEAEATRAQLETLFPADKGFAVGKVIKAKNFVAERDSVGRGFMEQLYGVLDKQGMEPKQRAELEDALGQLYLSSLPDLSWAKHGIHRKGTAGYSQDARRAFAQNVFHGASYLAKLRYGDQLQDQLRDMQRRVDEGASDAAFDSVRAQQVVDEMTKRHDAAMNPKTNALSTALTSVGFMFHLGLSPASAMVNLTQTALVAYPVMGARWGFAKSSAALLKASAEAARGKNDISSALSADEKTAYDEAVRSGVIDVTMAHDLAGIAQGEDSSVSWKLRPVMRAASFMFHHAEKFNRQVTFIASYRLAREAGADSKAAYEQAVQATYDGHFDYSSNNRPRVMQGNVARVLLLFKQYGQNMVYTFVRSAQQSLAGATPQDRAQARKALGGLLVMHGMAAGALGLPMVTTLLAAASMLGGDDDEPWDAQVALQNMLADTFGQKPAEVLAHGISRLTPWDISGRVALDKLIFPDVQEGLEGQRLAESAMAAALGPVAGIGINALRGAQLISQGQYARGLEAMAPSVLRGPLKAIRYGDEGVVDKTGIVVQDEVDAAALMGQAAGFSPSSVRNAYEGKAAIVQHDRALQARRKALVERYAMAAMAKDEESKAEARGAIQRFNEKNPERRVLPMQLVQSVRQREKRIREAEDGVYLPKKRRDALGAGRFAAPD